METHAIGTNVRMTSQCSEIIASTPAACTTAAIGKTISTAMSPCTVADKTFEIATSHIGHGAWTRSSISRVNPNSWAMVRAIDWTPWNMTEIPTTPGTSTVAKSRAPAEPDPPTAWPIFGKTKRKTKQSRNGWINVRKTNSLFVFHTTTRSRRISATMAVRLASKTLRVGCTSKVGYALMRRAAPCR